MAPALVELSTSKERNSSSKKYIENFSCMSRLNLELVDKIRFVDSSPLFTCDIDKKVNENLNSKEFISQVMVSHESEKTPISNRNGNLHKVIKEEVILNLKSESFKNQNSNNHIKQNGCADLIPHVEKIIDKPTCCATTIDVNREPQPVAEFKPTSQIKQLLKSKEQSISNNFSYIDNNLNSLNERLKRLSSKSLSSNVACFVSKSKKVLNYHDKPKEKDYKSCKTDFSKSKSLPLPLKLSYDLLPDPITDNEDDLDVKQHIPFGGKRQKSSRPAPPSNVLHQWKQNRAKIGSQCSWLTLKMAALDDKISSLNKVHTNLKTSRTVRNHTFDEAAKRQVQLNNRNGLNDTSQADCGCSRTRPLLNSQYHKYLRQNKYISPTSNQDSYSCHCIGGSAGCRFCTKRFRMDMCSQTKVELDQNYHPILSQQSDVSLSYLLEETLRKQRINTKVTITKSKKKKKRPQSLTTHSPIGEKVEKALKAKSKSERSKSDEYSRKRYAASDISSKLKKFRKLSESCDSASKPSTPTNELASPLSQSLPSTGLSGLKKKKGASANYDIDNIVIPYSIASSTRVERIQYKEIPTPGWRAANDLLNNDEIDLQDELTDDETFRERHSRCEVTEQKRFTDYFQPVRRQRSVRTISEGPNSEPPSPHMIDERSLVNTPLESPNPMKILQNRLANVCECTEAERDLPWLPRKFPLSELETVKLEVFSAPPSPCFGEPPKRIPKPSSLSRSSSYTHLANITPRNSPIPSMSPLASPPTPESNWTVKVLNNADNQDMPTVHAPTLNDKQQRKGIVLKLAKK